MPRPSSIVHLHLWSTFLSNHECMLVSTSLSNIERIQPRQQGRLWAAILRGPKNFWCHYCTYTRSTVSVKYASHESTTRDGLQLGTASHWSHTLAYTFIWLLCWIIAFRRRFVLRRHAHALSPCCISNPAYRACFGALMQVHDVTGKASTTHCLHRADQSPSHAP
ncbi:uncharacterized protein K452DRAFT_19523 [Aplosporella prunicola CBS 121167]|uniref:Uncharacterized protein n=1 Tax=Aplosporella prunicola CBS 121167 TaxID=1176127 RepID=A0A6A6BFY3_9PEZI|nr:uncharacterized protein K452DRAFT_19523 [Aplosporella prunicola CBS 121167]KAF2142478.1 hypothetical protein K452DRAFT_19523 [Aplosporella prunicola CBS 121167]